MKLCSMPDCGKPSRTLGWCQMHYRRWRVHGNPHTMLIREKGTGSFDQGYKRVMTAGISKQEHTILAERALGRPLPPEAVVHHVNENRSDNHAPFNLVICPNRAYHKLIHQRMDAMKACGHADWLKCMFCKQYSPPEEIVQTRATKYHRACEREYRNRLRQRRPYGKQSRAV